MRKISKNRHFFVILVKKFTFTVLRVVCYSISCKFWLFVNQNFQWFRNFSLKIVKKKLYFYKEVHIFHEIASEKCFGSHFYRFEAVKFKTEWKNRIQSFRSYFAIFPKEDPHSNFLGPAKKSYGTISSFH